MLKDETFVESRSRNIMECSHQSKNNYPLLDIAQFTAAILVILVHCGRLVADPQLHFILKSLLCRAAVPLFLISTGYFFREKTKVDPTYASKFFCRNIKDYLLWSLVYLPYGYLWIRSLNIPANLYLPALLIGLVYCGICYHLWYYPGMFLGLTLTKKLVERFNYAKIFLAAGLLYCFGALETYSAYLGHSCLGQAYNAYRSIFITTRNGLFFSFIFILLGFFLSDYKNSPLFQKYLPAKILLSSVLLGIEGWVIYQNQGNDKNFLFSLLPLGVFLVAFCLHSNKLKDKDLNHLRSWSKYLFLIHPMFLELLKTAAKNFGSSDFEGMPLFICTLICTCFAVNILMQLQHRKNYLLGSLQMKFEMFAAKIRKVLAGWAYFALFSCLNSLYAELGKIIARWSSTGI